MVKLWCSAFDRIRVPARPAQHVHRRVPDVRRRTRPSASTIGGGYTGHDHQASCRGSHGERVPTCAGGRAARSCYFLGLHTLRNNSLPVRPFLERFLIGLHIYYMLLGEQRSIRLRPATPLLPLRLKARLANRFGENDGHRVVDGCQ